MASDFSWCWIRSSGAKGKLHASFKNIIAFLQTSNQVFFLANIGDSFFFFLMSKNRSYCPSPSRLPTHILLGASLSGGPGVWARSNSVYNSERQNSTEPTPALVPPTLPSLGLSAVSNPPCHCYAILLRAGWMPSVTNRGCRRDEPWLRLWSDGLVGLQRDSVKGSLQLFIPNSFSEHLQMDWWQCQYQRTFAKEVRRKV